MSSSKRITTAVTIAVPLLALIAAAPLGAQARDRELSLSAGAMAFDATGSGTAPTAAARVALPVGRCVLLVEGSVAYASLDEQVSPPATRVALAEVQLQAQRPSGRVRPYVGVGGGWLRYLNNAYTRKTTTPTLSAAAGVRAGVSAHMGVRGELRLRAWDWDPGFGGRASELTGGLTYSF